MTAKAKVILRHCKDYDSSRIQSISQEIVSDLGVEIKGRVFIKPNVVTANRQYIHNSFTSPVFTEGIINTVRKHKIDDLRLGESSGFGIPTSLFFYESGYTELAEKLNVSLVNLNEDELTRVELKKARWHKNMLLANSILNADTKIWLPKLKYHIFCSITQALKLNIGILTHKERMLYHDHRIHEKIVDLLEAGYPDLVLTDAIDITYGFESAPYPVRLGLILGANDPLAADVVAAHIMGYDPNEIIHLKEASERGYGSLDINDIEIEGDYDLQELIDKPKGNTRLFQFLNELDTPIEFYAGKAVNSDVICDGGCEGALKGCLGTIEKRTPGSLSKAKKGAIVTGIYDGDVITDGPVLLVGTCTKVNGKLEAKSIHRVGGCPTAARDLLIKVPFLFGLKSPMFSFRDALLFIRFTLEELGTKVLRFFGFGKRKTG